MRRAGSPGARRAFAECDASRAPPCSGCRCSLHARPWNVRTLEVSAPGLECGALHAVPVVQPDIAEVLVELHEAWIGRAGALAQPGIVAVADLEVDYEGHRIGLL